MFLLNSRLGLFSAASFEAPLLPKLRGHFAEFLNNASLAHLRILSSSTCVGLRYGHLYTISTSFSRQCASWKFVTFYFHYIFRYESFLFLAFLPLLRPLTFFKVSVVQEFQPAIHQIRLLGLSLGPDLPWADEPSPGNLRLSMAWILTMLSLLIPAFSLLSRPHILSIMLRPTIECSSTTYIFLCKSAISVYSLAPVIFRAISLDQ